MPIHKDFLQVYEEVRVKPGTKEATVLKALYEQDSPTVQSVADNTTLSEDVIQRAVRRLEDKDLIEKCDDGTFDLSDYAQAFADAYVPNDEL